MAENTLTCEGCGKEIHAGEKIWLVDIGNGEQVLHPSADCLIDLVQPIKTAIVADIDERDISTEYLNEPKNSASAPTPGSWMNKGQDKDRNYVIASCEVNEYGEDTAVAYVCNERDLGVIIHAPQLLEVLEELVKLNLFKERIGETSEYKRKATEVWERAEQLLSDFIDCD